MDSATDFKVEWNNGTGCLALQTKKAAMLLADAFHTEGQDATAYENVNGEWAAIS